MPIYERYFVGGINTIRGFQLFSLGPQGQRAVVAGAVGVPVAVQHRRQHAAHPQQRDRVPDLRGGAIKGVIFFDIGNAYNTETATLLPVARWRCRTSPTCSTRAHQYPTFTNLRYSVGFGFRWFSPIGPLRFEWGIPLDAQPGEDPIVFEFTIGNFF